jgi:hypothetical protein
MRTPLEIFEEVLGAWGGLARAAIEIGGAPREARARAHQESVAAVREEFQEAMGPGGTVHGHIETFDRPSFLSFDDDAPAELTASADEAFRGVTDAGTTYDSIEPAGSVVKPPRVGPGDHLLRPAADDELVCAVCGRPHVLHGINCPMLSVPEQAELTIVSQAESLLQESRHRIEPFDDEEFRRRRDESAERYTRPDGSSR